MAIVLDVGNLGTNSPAGAGGTVVLTTTSPVAAGATIVVWVGFFDATQTLQSVADSGGSNVYTVNVQGKNGSDAVAIASAYAPSGLASGATITATFTASVAGDRDISASSFLGVATSAPGYGGASNPQSATAAWTSASITTTAGGDMVCAFSKTDPDSTSSTITAPSVEDNDFSGGSRTVTGAHRIDAAAGSYTVAGTWAAATGTQITVATAMKAAVSGATVNTIFRVGRGSAW